MENLTMWISIVVFLLTYVFIIWDKFDRAVVALSGAFLLLIFNILEQEQALQEIDFNTIGLLAGMMIIVMIIKRTGVFEYIAIRIVKLSKADPFKIVIYLSLGACLGGNGTVIGASANVVAVGLAEEQGIKITFGKFFKEAFLLMLLSILLSTAYLLIMFF